MRILFPILVVSIVPFSAACSNFLDLGGSDDPAPAVEPQPDKPAEGASQAKSSALTTYCIARKNYADKCSSVLDGCEAAEGKECLTAFSIYREDYTKALTTCSSGFAQTCGDHHESDVKYNCLIDERDKLAPTTAMTSLAADLCKSCPGVNGAACPGEKFFFHGKRLESGGITVSGQGAIFDMYSDEVVAKLRDACLPMAKGSSCWQSFYDCVDWHVEQLSPKAVKDACASKIPNDGPVPPTIPPKP